MLLMPPYAVRTVYLEYLSPSSVLSSENRCRTPDAVTAISDSLAGS
jgi:hypothetical protein